VNFILYFILQKKNKIMIQFFQYNL
jgi:hypothetical protein